LDEGSVVDEKLLLGNVKVVVEKVEELLLHEVDLGEGEEGSVSLPMLVLGRRVVEILGGADEGGKEDSVSGAVHA
jgi:hypothetical protein